MVKLQNFQGLKVIPFFCPMPHLNISKILMLHPHNYVTHNSYYSKNEFSTWRKPKRPLTLRSKDMTSMKEKKLES